MKKLFSKIIALVITIALLMSSMGTISVFAEKTAESTSKNGSVNIKVTVQERNGIYVKDFFFRRGIALEEGLVYDPEICQYLRYKIGTVVIVLALEMDTEYCCEQAECVIVIFFSFGVHLFKTTVYCSIVFLGYLYYKDRGNGIRKTLINTLV